MSRDLRQYARQTNVRLAAGAVFMLFVVGLGLIYLIYGPGAAMMGLTCMLAGMLPIALILLAFLMLDWIVKRARRS
jgi:hypothetical protein